MPKDCSTFVVEKNELTYDRSAKNIYLIAATVFSVAVSLYQGVLKAKNELWGSREGVLEPKFEVRGSL